MLNKACSACRSKERVQIETVTNIAPKRDDMFPVMLCAKCKIRLSRGELDIKLNPKGDLIFVAKKKSR